jgi:hypothetical protein
VSTNPSQSAAGEPSLGDKLPGAGERRQFIGQLVAGAAALAAASCTRAGVAAPAAAPTPAPPPGGATAAHTPDAAAQKPAPAHPTWDLTWTDRLTGKHRQVFDAPEIASGTVLHQARMFYVNYKEVYSLPDTDLRAVLVIRHEALPMVLGDAVWNHYDFIGKKITKLKDPTTGEWARRNPFLNAKKDDKYTLIWPDGDFESLIARGAIVLACNMAFNGFAHVVATRTKQKPETVHDEFKAALVPGVTLVPSGIFGVIRAEEGGCSYLRAT